MAAVMQVLESWLYFQKGDAKRAVDILQTAEAVLSKTDDYLRWEISTPPMAGLLVARGDISTPLKVLRPQSSRYRKRDRNIANVCALTEITMHTSSALRSPCNCVSKIDRPNRQPARESLRSQQQKSERPLSSRTAGRSLETATTVGRGMSLGSCASSSPNPGTRELR